MAKMCRGIQLPVCRHGRRSTFHSDADDQLFYDVRTVLLPGALHLLSGLAVGRDAGERWRRTALYGVDWQRSTDGDRIAVNPTDHSLLIRQHRLLRVLAESLHPTFVQVF